MPRTRTPGQRAADIVAGHSGSWPFILGYLGVTTLYLAVNHWVIAFDVTLQYYTFGVSVAAIFLAQVILLSQNRQAATDEERDDREALEVKAMYDLQQQETASVQLLHQINEQQLAILHELRERRH